MISLFDTHCHLDMLDDPDAAIMRATKEGVTRILSVGIDHKSSQQAVGMAQKHPGVFAAVGCHPHDADGVDDHVLAEMEGLVHDHRGHIVAYGEIGLDYAKKYTPKKQQKICFLKQLALAKHLRLPVLIHSRDAETDMLAFLREQAPFPHGGIIHCFTGDTHFAHAAMQLGFFLSIPGIITYPSAHGLREAVQKIPLNRLVIETDAPFLAPVPMRGKKNEPAFLRHTAMEVAQQRGISYERLAEATTRNACTLFNLP